MPRGVFISYWNLSMKGIDVGNSKKVHQQYSTFKEYGYLMSLVGKETEIKIYKNKIFERIVTKFKNACPFLTNNYIFKYKDIGKYDFYYIRFKGYDFFFNKLIKEIKMNNPKALIILEFPDYPYLNLSSKEILGNYMIKIKDYYGRKKSHKYIDRYVLMNNMEYFYGKPVINIMNGIDAKKIQCKKYIKSDNINIICVASFQPAHGIDRFLKGMREYYRHPVDKKIILHLVGGGDCVSDLKRFVLENNLDSYVNFYGFLYGEQLNNIYDLAHIGIEVLAFSRKNIKVSSSLKSREYVVRGLPFITGSELDFENNFNKDYYLKIDDCEVPVDMNLIINFYNKIYSDESRIINVIQEIHDWGMENLDMTKTMLPVFNYIDEVIKNE